MNTTEQSIYKILEELHIPIEEHAHKAVFTVNESQDLKKQLDATETKSLFLTDKANSVFLLVVMYGLTRLDIKLLQKKLDIKKLYFAKPDHLQKLLHVTPGSVSPFALRHKTAQSIQVIVDTHLVEKKRIGFHPSDNTKTLIISGKDLITFLKHTQNPYTLVNLSEQNRTSRAVL